MAMPEVASVESIEQQLLELLQRARQVKKVSTIDPPLPVAELSKDHGRLLEVTGIHAQNAATETAARNLLHRLVASTSIDQPSFIEVWNLLDILQECGDRDECDPALVFWLIEELLDSQTMDGCRKVFDFLESRRERLVARNFFPTKNLVALRSCNELLRRLSRAEDAVFCGRVFIFLFQCFPLGDKSSVNLRGEFHVENVTTFERSEGDHSGPREAMDVDDNPKSSNTIAETGQTPVDEAGKTSTRSTGIKEEQKTLDTDTLYPIFWQLQQAFSNPPSLFSQQNLDEFKAGLQATLSTFRAVPKVIQSQGVDVKRGVKRKHGEGYENLASNYNPKYLTSRDLFKLELSDLAFQRHILVQALILIDFLLSLTEKSKTKLAQLNTQKALQYSFTLSEQDAEWALNSRTAIANYLREGPEGNFYYRMVDTVLSRDKNWVRWKMENCPPIARERTPAQVLLEAKSGARRACATRRLKNTDGAINLSFLSEDGSTEGVNHFDESRRFVVNAVPSAEFFVKEIQMYELDLEMAATEDEKQKLQDDILGTTWRALRVAARDKLSLFDKVDDGKNLQRLLQSDASEGPVRDDSLAGGASEGRNDGSVAEHAEQEMQEGHSADDGNQAASETAAK
ncbi:hypothetical protein W97_04595 [Coniosporium apollinis CBS 100218]|uniref:Nuclear matrix protein n=1 Tax=Coniosporium apollinis (strain CBS 100218) TaxID=1168221 RepID=R7YTV6_CONA1|nr:uncharacterized protein W97_04595 [Coniosporium apollinis CBS 100218]EON65357.1 hypothetical protein W97_04595 [Coniosporium apollinis CBS 100218]